MSSGRVVVLLSLSLSGSGVRGSSPRRPLFGEVALGRAPFHRSNPDGSPGSTPGLSKYSCGWWSWPSHQVIAGAVAWPAMQVRFLLRTFCVGSSNKIPLLSLAEGAPPSGGWGLGRAAPRLKGTLGVDIGSSPIRRLTLGIVNIMEAFEVLFFTSGKLYPFTFFINKMFKVFLLTSVQRSRVKLQLPGICGLSIVEPNISWIFRANRFPYVRSVIRFFGGLRRRPSQNVGVTVDTYSFRWLTTHHKLLPKNITSLSGRSSVVEQRYSRIPKVAWFKSRRPHFCTGRLSGRGRELITRRRFDSSPVRFATIAPMVERRDQGPRVLCRFESYWLRCKIKGTASEECSPYRWEPDPTHQQPREGNRV